MLKRKPGMQKSLDGLSRGMGFTPQKEAEEKGICSRCKKPVGAFKDDISRREYNITGFCQECQDWLFAAPEEEDE